jgi:transposase
MANRQFKLTEKEITAFQEAEQATRDVRELKRLQAVRLYGIGETVGSIQKLVGCGAVSPRQWAGEYKRGGLVALQSHWAKGNARKLTVEQGQELKQKLMQYTPEQVISPMLRVERGEFWTVSDLRIVVERWFSVTYESETSYRNLLHRCGLSYQKAERVYRSRPSAEQLAVFEEQVEKK